MLFNSFTFLHFFLPVFLVVYFLTKSLRVKNIIILIASLFFYAWGEEKLVVLLLLSAVAGYYTGGIIGKGEKKLGLMVCLIYNLSVLFFYKYINFFIDIFNDLTGVGIQLVEINLPIGISFFTFQTMSYSIDVYREKIKPSKNFLDFACYVCMFPQLIAGPIVRYEEIEKDLVGRTHSWEKVKQGSERFVIGLAKKMIVANYFALISDNIFNSSISQLTFYDTWLGIICYSFQIFFDFSAYSDMAIGLGMILGFKFPENFNYPYISKSIREFWRRWHMTMSFWFRDYVYISLGGNRVGVKRVYLNLLIVFIVTGLWHGASWNFVLWGLIHGFFIILERLFPKLLSKIPDVIKWFYTILVVMSAWVFFRTESIGDAFIYLSKMFSFNFNSTEFYRVYFIDSKFYMMTVLSLLLCSPLLYYKILLPFKNKKSLYSGLYYTCIIILFVFSLMYLSTSSYDPFIYFRF